MVQHMDALLSTELDTAVHQQPVCLPQNPDSSLLGLEGAFVKNG